ncbi:MAG TPA: ABC transporter substrate-binding protein [Bryobacteraceae bacterium]|nr:ABC transporter substrate-binding protein [Bryobacteraceae bacterium]
MPRIVSLISSATEIVHALGQFHNQVGRSHECDFPPEAAALPVCTKPAIDIHADSREIDRQVKQRVRDALSVYEVFDSALEQLQPTHILTQTQCEVCAVSLRDVEQSVARRLASRPKIVSLNATSLAEVWEDVRRVARSLDIAERGESVVAGLEARICAVSQQARAAGERPRVACIEWIEPLMAAGNWTPELVELAGGVNLFGEPGKHSPWMSWDDLASRDPDVIVIAPRHCAQRTGNALADRAGGMAGAASGSRWASVSRGRESVFQSAGSQAGGDTRDSGGDSASGAVRKAFRRERLEDGVETRRAPLAPIFRG